MACETCLEQTLSGSRHGGLSRDAYLIRSLAVCSCWCWCWCCWPLPPLPWFLGLVKQGTTVGTSVVSERHPCTLAQSTGEDYRRRRNHSNILLTFLQTSNFSFKPHIKCPKCPTIPIPPTSPSSLLEKAAYASPAPKLSATLVASPGKPAHVGRQDHLRILALRRKRQRSPRQGDGQEPPSRRYQISLSRAATTRLCGAETTRYVVVVTDAGLSAR